MKHLRFHRTARSGKLLKILMLFVIHFSLFTIHCFAQPPAIKYQAVARNAAGEPVAEQQISIKLSLHSTAPEGGTPTDSYEMVINVKDNSTTIYAAANVTDYNTGSGDKASPYRLDRAIDEADNGDEVILLEGNYMRLMHHLSVE